MIIYDDLCRYFRCSWVFPLSSLAFQWFSFGLCSGLSFYYVVFHCFPSVSYFIFLFYHFGWYIFVTCCLHREAMSGYNTYRSYSLHIVFAACWSYNISVPMVVATPSVSQICLLYVQFYSAKNLSCIVMLQQNFQSKVKL